MEERESDTFVNYSSMELDSIPLHFKDKHMVKSMNLSFNRIQSASSLLPSSHPLLVYLNLSHNCLSHVPDAIAYLPSLLTLKLNSNLISDFSPLSNVSVSGPRPLKELWIGDNMVSTLDHLAQGLQGLTSLEHIVILPNELCRMVDYRKLVISQLPMSTKTLDGIPISRDEEVPFTEMEVNDVSNIHDGDTHDVYQRNDQPLVLLEERMEETVPEKDTKILTGDSPSLPSTTSIAGAVGLLPDLSSLFSSHTSKKAVMPSIMDKRRSRRKTPSCPSVSVSRREVEPIDLFYKSGTRAVSIREDGTGSIYYPNRSLAISIELDEVGYRLFAKYSNGSVACLFDGSGNGTATFPSGQDALSITQDGGVLRGSQGDILKCWNQEKGSSPIPCGPVSNVKLDKHLAISYDHSQDNMFLYFKAESIHIKIGRGEYEVLQSGTDIFGNIPVGSAHAAIKCLHSPTLTHSELLHRIRQSTNDIVDFTQLKKNLRESKTG